MFDNIIFVILLLFGGLFSLLALFFFIIGLVRRSKAMFTIGVFVAMLPLSIFGYYYWKYEINFPVSTKRFEKQLAGKYILFDSSRSFENAGYFLNLYNNNTFVLQQNPKTSFHGKGNWRANATEEGAIEFSKKNEGIMGWAFPHGTSELTFGDGPPSIIFRKVRE